MTNDFFSLAIERDDTLIKYLCGASRNMRNELREWAQSEVKALNEEAQLFEFVADEPARERLFKVFKDLDAINRIDLPEVVTDYDDTIKELELRGAPDVYEAYDQLETRCSRLVKIVRQLLEIRRVIGEMGE